jgi:hypothetical protein
MSQHYIPRPREYQAAEAVNSRDIQAQVGTEMSQHTLLTSRDIQAQVGIEMSQHALLTIPGIQA